MNELARELAYLLNTFAFISSANMKFEGFEEKEVKSESKSKTRQKERSKAKGKVKVKSDENKIIKSFCDLVRNYQRNGYDDRSSVEMAYINTYGPKKLTKNLIKVK
jgi:hypothetical protein